ncbi:MAG: formylmethanofuran dehydrogenase subunit [Methanothermococcus sp.]|jgi:formylmethanofuran dehydrogenase subunit E|nr:formylmethanofuran dehydrogenase subunit [Methanothermococcus sp.]
MGEKMDVEWERAVEFHGHECPGLAIGYRVAKYIQNHYNKSEDEELVAIVENNSCSVDAIQHMLSCTFGKGNLIFKDNGKHAYTFYSRDNRKALRIYFKDDFFKDIEDMRKKYNKDQLTEKEKEEFIKIKKEITERILNANDEELFEVKEVDIPAPRKAKLYPSIKCEECGEYFMEIKGRIVDGKIVCKECFEKLA